MGDSIAVGTHQVRQECASLSKTGITSHGWDKTFGNNDLTAGTVIISLGTNDWDGANTYKKLKEIRAKINSPRVFWFARSVPFLARRITLRNVCSWQLSC